VLQPEESSGGFRQSALLTLLGLFAISAGLFRSGGLESAPRLIGLPMPVPAPKRMICCLNQLWWPPVSAFVTKHTDLAPFCPCDRRAGAIRRAFLLEGAAPLSFCHVLEGTLTLIGSSVNLAGQRSEHKLGLLQLSILFTFTPIGIGVWLACKPHHGLLSTASCRSRRQ